MTERQKRAAATISFGIVVLAALSLAILAIQVGASSAPLGDRFAGRQFVLLVHTRGFLETLLQALPPIISLGMSIVAVARLKDWQFYATVGVTVAGVVLCVYLVMELSDPIQAQRIWAYSPIDEIDSYASFTSATRPLLLAAGSWFIAVLGIQLGLTAPSRSGQAAAPSPPTSAQPAPGTPAVPGGTGAAAPANPIHPAPEPPSGPREKEQ